MGIDVGSTTVKIVVLDDDKNIKYSEYRRHYSDIKTTVLSLFDEVISNCLVIFNDAVMNNSDRFFFVGMRM